MRTLQLFLLAAVISIVGCSKNKDNEKENSTPPTVPVLSIASIDNVASDKAKATAVITSDGGSPVTDFGICWSTTNATPTILDNKVTGVAAAGSFSGQLSGLSSSTNFYFRAYAINTVGVGYGNVSSFSTSNAPPFATEVSITGVPEINATLTVNYQYNDADRDSQDQPAYQWYSASSASGAGESAITGATGKTFAVADVYLGKYLRAGVVVKASKGVVSGIEAKSAFTIAIPEPSKITFNYNGASVTYGILTSSITGRKWLDRNLGASKIGNEINDFPAYGDLFQWGRAADGHQLISRTGTGATEMTGLNANSAPGATAPTDVPGNSSFIILPAATPPFDWRTTPNNNLWQGVNGINNPCPSGYRLPTIAEFVAENLTDFLYAHWQLRFVATGRRNGNGSGISDEFYGYYWTSSMDAAVPGSSISVRLSGGFLQQNTSRSQGCACRCIKN